MNFMPHRALGVRYLLSTIKQLRMIQIESRQGFFKALFMMWRLYAISGVE
ncbi:hypothetical protein DM56_2224 [Burkholderia mallei]|nr:hypothetical protein DO73_4825 [Burkholderia pseudomallei]KGS23245.1 hypothetical protein X989_2689 [Burkholderia pseudomallei MSHR4378]KGS80324.1 hypothetical protein X976_3107 [Burkholderia pseudomallei MSHR7500]KGS82893.1 hypothetical protein X942_2875 [Burkholderia pseudomallei MSHR5596]KOS75724.1 hypothetical protein DM46_1758 [Burkholderia mallei]